jgi:TolB-like protein/Tfp pilus assembly protein PilF/tRNA A-37 threonylcarbamoyl transferase component Bud32
MTTERWQQIELVFQNALDLAPGEERERYLTDACADDAELRSEVDKLVAQHERAGSFISVGAIERGELPEMTEEIDNLIGQRIGSYRLISEVGRGGMGAVYEAERADNSFQRRVAVKFIKRGMDTDLILKRFRNERQILASLNHPNIARLLDGGTTTDGLPYFVMEFIEGEPLYRYCDNRKLGVTARLELFRQICDAVDEAHRNKVVHRDLKPSNILVKPDGTAKLLDFGIAKLLDPELAGATIEQTATQMRLMTPEYASPEQVCGEPVTPAADIYSLGVLLYELLTGHRPYRFKNRAMHEISRVVCEQQPLAPSESLTREDNLVPTGASDKATLDEIIRARSENLETLRHQLSGNLDRVILKALRKEPGERYQSAADLHADIARVLEKRPVTAESFDSPKKNAFASDEPKQPEKNSVAILPFKTLGAPGGTGDLSEEYLGVGLADALVSRLSNVRRLVIRPTSSVLNYARRTTDSFEAGKDLGVEFVVDGNIRRAGERIRVTVQLLHVEENSARWAQTFDEKFTDVLELEDTISEKIAGSLVPHLTGEEQKQLQKRGTNNPQAYEAYLRGRFYWNQFTPEALPKALASFQTAVALDPEYALAYVGLADFYIWANIYGLIPSAQALDQAEAAARRAVEMDERLGEAYASLGLIMQNRRRWAEAEKLQRQAIKLNPHYVHAHEWYAAQLVGLGRTEEGVEEMLRAESLDPLSLRTKTLTAWTLLQARRFDEALERGRQIVELDKNYPQGYSQIGLALWAMGRAEEALENFRILDRIMPGSALVKYELCFGLVAANRQAEAREVFEEIKTLASESYIKPYFLGMVHTAIGERDRAFELFEQSFAEFDPWMLWFGTDPMLESLHDDERFVSLLERMDNPLGAQYRAKLPQKPKTRGARTNGEKSIAVLPLKILGGRVTGGEDDDYLGVGLADALTTRLSNVRKFVVRPTSSVLKFGGEQADAFAAGRELEVDFVLDGTVRRAGNRIRVTAQLLNVGENSTAWAERFDENAADVLELEDSISEKVAKSLIPHLTGAEAKQLQKRGTNNPDAYEAFMRGRFYWSLQTEDGFARAIKLFERAVELDPDYALAFSAIAEYYIYLAIHCVLPFAEATSRAKVAALKAVEIDADSAEAQNALGTIVINQDFDWKAGENYMRRAIETNPNIVSARRWYNALLIQSGRLDEAMNEARKIIELDPDSVLSLHYTAWTHYHARRYDESLEVHRRMLGGEPFYAWGHLTLSWTLRCAGKFDEAIAAARKSVTLAPKNPMYYAGLAAAQAASGDEPAARLTLVEIEKLSAENYVSPFMQAIVYCWLGDFDRTFELLERAFDERDVWVAWIGIDPQFDSIRGDGRYFDLLRRMNHPLAPAPQTTAQTGKRIQKTKSENGAKAVAVLPLKFIGARQPDDAYLGIGLADAMITRLSQVGRLIVRPTSAVLQFGETTDSFEAGRKLDVDFVLDGTIRRAGARVRISAQLLDVKSNSTRWAESFDENLTDVLDLEDRVAEKVARLLIPRLTGEEKQKLAKRGTDNAEAYEAHLRGRYHLKLFTPDNFALAKDYFEQAIRLDPDYALAYIGLADCYFCLGTFAAESPLECYRHSREMAEKALDLDETLGEGYTILGFVEFSQQYDFGKADELLRRGIELNPNNSLGRVWYSVSLTAQKQFDKAVEEARRAVETNPVSPFEQQHYAWILYHTRRFDESLAHSSKMVEINPYFSHARGIHSWILRHLNRLEESISHAEAAVELSNANPWLVGNLAASYARAGQRERALEVLSGLGISVGERYVSPYSMAIAYYFLGETDKVFARLEEAYAARDVWLIWLGVEPQFDSLRGDSRFQDLLRRINSSLFK